MNIIRILLLRAFVLVILSSSFVYLTYGKEGPSVVQIMRNVAWNDFITQIKFLPDDSPQDSLDSEMLVILKFLKAHETEGRVGIYDLEVFRAIDQARARLQKADKDLETLRNELPTKKSKQTGGGDPWNSEKSSPAASASSPSSLEQISDTSASRFQVWTAITFSTAGFVAGTAGKLS